MWSPDGSEVFYVVEPGRMMAVPVDTGQSFSHGSPRLVFEGSYYTGLLSRNYDVSPDGRFLMIRQGSLTDAAPPQLVLVQNWFEELKRLVPTR